MLGLNSLLLALLLGIWVLKRGNLWGACAIHAAWIFVGSFLFGFAPAGEHAGIRLLDMDTDAFRPLLTGGDFGPEASICATVVLLAALALLLALTLVFSLTACSRQDSVAGTWKYTMNLVEMMEA